MEMRTFHHDVNDDLLADDDAHPRVINHFNRRQTHTEMQQPMPWHPHSDEESIPSRSYRSTQRKWVPQVEKYKTKCPRGRKGRKCRKRRRKERNNRIRMKLGLSHRREDQPLAMQPDATVAAQDYQPNVHVTEKNDNKIFDSGAYAAPKPLYKTCDEIKCHAGGNCVSDSLRGGE